LSNEAAKQKNIIYELVGHLQILKRWLTWFKAITIEAKTLLGLCDQFCVLKSNENIKTLADSNVT